MDKHSQDQILSNYNRVLEQIEQAARTAGRAASEVRLVVVTKGHPLEAVEEAIAAGARIFGENYAEEGAAKALACQEQAGLEWHMIGHVQSRKARLVCETYDWLHSLENLKLARRLDQFAAEVGSRLPVLLECNVSGEETKFGLAAWQEPLWPDLLQTVSQIVALPNLEMHGLMTMAPFLPEAEQARPYFERLRQLRDFFAAVYPQVDWRELSMGMSADFPAAIQEGATMVRIGTAILGPRPQFKAQS